MLRKLGISTGWILGIFILFIVSPIYFIFYPKLAGKWVFPIMGTTRASVDYTRRVFHVLGSGIEQGGSGPVAFLAEPYFGPLGGDRLSLMASRARGPKYLEWWNGLAANPRTIVDPFNRESPRGDWVRSIRYVDDQGGVVKLLGGPFTFYSSGAGDWMLIGRGPDGDLDLNRGMLDSAEWPEMWQNPLFLNVAYDPTNGSISSGDIWKNSN